MTTSDSDAPWRASRAKRLQAIALGAFGVGPAFAQTEYIPYFGKNQIRYDKFDWRIYTTDHFEIYYYPEIEPHLERIAFGDDVSVRRDLRGGFRAADGFDAEIVAGAEFQELPARRSPEPRPAAVPG